MNAVRWRRAKHPSGQWLNDIGVTAAGELINPRGYDESLVRETLAHTAELDHKARSAAAAKAANTRRRRRALKVYSIAERINAGASIGPRTTCASCGRGLIDQESIARGIGSECWSDVLATITRLAESA